MIGHNIKTFDCRIIVKYFAMFGLHLDITNKKYIDTMTESKHLLQLKNKNGSIKNPSLVELSCFFNIRSENSEFHDAFYDVYITYLCYVNLKKICLF